MRKTTFLFIVFILVAGLFLYRGTKGNILLDKQNRELIERCLFLYRSYEQQDAVIIKQRIRIAVLEADISESIIDNKKIESRNFK